MAFDVARMCGPVEPLDIGRRCNRQHRSLDQFARDQSRKARLTEADRQVNPFRDEVADMLPRYKLKQEFRILIAELTKATSKDERQEERININLQPFTYR